MSRIRSVHPGLWTDEAFVCLSDAAQIFFIGLWTECDDQGAFEWKPVQLRLKLRGNRDGSIEPILAELEEANCIKSYEHGGRKYGLVRNFQRYQRPKKPNSVHFIPDEFRTYVGSAITNTEPVPHQFPTSGEKSLQMEEEGGRMEDEGGSVCSAHMKAEEGSAELSQEIQGYLDNRAEDLTQWEERFLISIKWADTLSKAQRDTLKGIREKLAPKDGDRVLPSVKRGTAAYDAWIAYWKRTGRPTAFYEKQDAITVFSEFPPQEQAA